MNKELLKEYSQIMTDLEKNFPQLASELKKLPELRNRISDVNLKALNSIYNLWKNAINPEIKEAFDLMLEGGIPDQKDFSYEVPKYNTELEVLFWLAEQNEFKQDDTLALAIALVNGLWITIGTDEVRRVVYKDTNDLLEFFRETNEMQKERNFHLLEDYPLEAKVCLAWTGNSSTHFSIYSDLSEHTLEDFSKIRLPLSQYQRFNIEVETLRKMRDIMQSKEWISSDVDKTLETLEEYFYFASDRHLIESLNTKPSIIRIHGMSSTNVWVRDIKFQFEFFLENNKVIGDCSDEADFVDSLCKSWGISTIQTKRVWNEIFYGHTFVSYYLPINKTWKSYNKQLFCQCDKKYYWSLFKPPIFLKHYLKTKGVYPNVGFYRFGYFIISTNENFWEFYRRFGEGIPTSQVKQWLLYSSSI